MHHPRLLRTIMMAALAAAGPALGQPMLPQGLPCKANLSAAEKQQVTAFADAARANLAAPGAEDVKRAREQLLATLGPACVTVEYRQTLTTALLESLQKNVTDPRDLVVVNSLRIAGELATSTTVNLILGSLGDQRPPVRYAATAALARAFEASRANNAVNANDLTRAVTALGEFLTAQTDAHLADGGVLALAAATRLDALRDVQVRAVSVLAQAASTRAQALAGDGQATPMLAVLTRAGTTLRDISARAAVAGALPETTLRDIAGLAGDLLAAASRLLAQSSPPDVSTIVQLAETMLLLAADGLNHKTQPINLAAALSAGNPAAFKKLLEDRVFGAGGVLPTLGFPPGRFKP